VKIHLTSVFVDDQFNALEFYTDVLGFTKKSDVPLGEHRWLTVVSPDDPDGTELVLETRRASSRPAIQGGARPRRHPVHVVRRRGRE
jgi:catechol 2,3-dioxygenase-like lactoylglutathione lyase family enzyme